MTLVKIGHLTGQLFKVKHGLKQQNRVFNQNFAKGGLNQQLEYLCLKIILFEQSAEQIGATQACYKQTFGGEASRRWVIFVLEQKIAV